MPESQYAAISRFLVPVDLPLGFRLSEPNQPIDHVYFLVGGLVSVDALTEKGESVEVGVLGREGFAGLSGLLGHPQMSHSVVMQGSGAGLRIRTNIVREEFLKGGEFARSVHSFIYMQMVQMAQSVLCNRLHPIEARMARWMLTACDRMQTDNLKLTQEFLAQMLGSRRSTVTVAAGKMQRRGLIDYRRGNVQIVNRLGLEAVACECYGIVRSTYDSLIGRNY
ncbi:Crp/Fnr family transcriptional regulator [Granulicella sp. WH15]|uniref:Crp/Fnr family transcriptional regulator n=1 Tax=Granulicella sp. WH15 TaxID=2602070 RepID=UPI00136715F5|nr:Crp/Fnr family transcriptional regulator [Granulicella sp. WH15]QHN04592.1 Crp/Fnr family transcriptional regulator [Granulicella sp. WH15]